MLGHFLTTFFAIFFTALRAGEQVSSLQNSSAVW